MKLFNKVVVFAIVACFSLQSLTAFGATTKKTKVDEIISLTVEEAAKKAIRNDTSIRNAEDDGAFGEDRYVEYVNNIRDQTTEIGVISAMGNLLQLELQQSLNIKDIAAKKENVEYTITKYFNSIIGYEKDVALYDESLALAERELAIKKLKLSLGMISQFEYDTALLDMEKTKSSRLTKVNAIDKAYRDLNKYMGVDLEEKYELVLDITFEPIEEINIDRYANEYVSNSLTIKSLENNAKVAKFSVDNYVVPHDVMTGQIRETVDTSYEAVLFNYNKIERTISDTKASLKQGVIDTYGSFKDIEINIKASEIEVQKLQSQLVILEKQLELGQTTQLTIDNLKYNIKNIELGIEKAKNSYAIAVIAFYNPNITASSATGY